MIVTNKNIINSWVINSRVNNVKTAIKYNIYYQLFYKFNRLVESATIFPSKLKREYYLFSKSGFTSDLIDSNIDNVHLYTLDDLFNI